MSKRVIIAVGGTGGHLFPAQALAEQLKHQSPGVELMFAGSGLEGNKFFDTHGYSYTDISSATFSGKGLLGKAGGAQEIAKGFFQARKLLKSFNPHTVVGFGSYHTLPILMAARYLGIPIVLHEGNAVPGRVNRTFSSHAKVTGVQFPEAAKTLLGRTLEVDLPLRQGYTLAYGTKEAARDYFGLSSDKFTFLVFGGSQGSLAVNVLFCSALSHVLAERTTNFQVIHLTGDENVVEEIAEEYHDHRINACVKANESQMDQAWRAADLAISRAGASTIAELLEFEVPAILIPYPHAMDNHQERNADHVVSIGGAIKLPEASLEAEELTQTIRQLVADNHSRLREMQRALENHKKNHKARDLCSVVCEVGGFR